MRNPSGPFRNQSGPVLNPPGLVLNKPVRASPAREEDRASPDPGSFGAPPKTFLLWGLGEREGICRILLRLLLDATLFGRLCAPTAVEENVTSFAVHILT